MFLQILEVTQLVRAGDAIVQLNRVSPKLEEDNVGAPNSLEQMFHLLAFERSGVAWTNQLI